MIPYYYMIVKTGTYLVLHILYTYLRQLSSRHVIEGGMRGIDLPLGLRAFIYIFNY